MSGDTTGRPVGPARLLTTLEQILAIDDTDPDTTLNRAAQIVSDVLGADKVDVFLYDPARESLVARGTSNTPMGRRQREIGMDRLPLSGRGRAAEVFESGQMFCSGHVDEDLQELIGIRQGLGVRSQVSVPLEIAGTRRGVVAAVSARADFFSPDDAAFLQAVARWTTLVMHRTELTMSLVSAAEDRGRRQLLQNSLGQLTPRQLEVATLIANGLTNQQIADRLVVTPGTVANHVAQLFDRLELASRTQVATLVAELGLHHQRLENDSAH
jgi:DNA-binding CsgD family transcriptional regulator